LLFFCPCSFFFKRSGYHLSLHSFPTRRSSDLTISPASSRERFASPPVNTNDFPANLSLLTCRFSAIGCTPALRNFLMSCRSRKRDRKSTRLNSSHVAISYAVFCLKKKK